MRTRGAFLASAGATIIGCAAPAVLPSPSPSAAAPTTPTATPTSLRTASPTPGPPDWSALAARLQAALVRPADAGYDAARVLYNHGFDGLRPQAIARRPSVA